MQCPHCRYEFDAKPHTFSLGIDRDGTWQVASTRCPTCERLIVNLCTDRGCTYPAWPATLSRPWLSADIPAGLAAAYHTAAQVLAYSPEAAAAIGRRLLSGFLADYLDAGDDGLAEQIEAVLTSALLPPYLKDALATWAEVAKLDPDQTKSALPQTLVAVEPGEAEWLLDVLDLLFELQFELPARMQRKVDALEEQIGPLHLAIEEEPEDAAQDEATEPGAGEEAPAAESDEAAEPAASVETVPEPAAGSVPVAATRAPDAAEATAAAAPVQDPAAEQAPAAEPGASPARESDRGGWRRLSGR
jgi:hypothetical protein